MRLLKMLERVANNKKLTSYENMICDRTKEYKNKVKKATIGRLSKETVGAYKELGKELKSTSTQLAKCAITTFKDIRTKLNTK